MTEMLLFFPFIMLLNNLQSLMIGIGFIDFLKKTFTLWLLFTSKGSYEQIPHSMPLDELLKIIFNIF